jgi:hypothetical protein
MLEDESGRIRLVGDRLQAEILVTGVIMAVLGMENPNGDFEVVDICFPEACPYKNTDVSSSAGVDGVQLFWCPLSILTSRYRVKRPNVGCASVWSRYRLRTLQRGKPSDACGISVGRAGRQNK